MAEGNNFSEDSQTDEDKKIEEFYKGFREKLVETTGFPSDYIYKFIIPTNHKKLAELLQIFDGGNANIQMKESKTGKYTSITIKIYVIDADQVIYYYKKAATIDGIIML